MISQEFHHNFIESFDLCSRFQFWKDDFEDDGQFLAIKTRFWGKELHPIQFHLEKHPWNTHIFQPNFHTERPAAWYPIGLSGEANQRFSKAKGEPPKQDMSREISGYIMSVFQCHLSHFVCLIDCLLACFGWFPEVFFCTQLLPLQKC